MKKKITVIGLIIVLLIIGIVIIMNCMRKDQEGPVKYVYQQSIHEEKDDGWIYVYQIYYQKNNKKNKMYMFNGYNLKYKELDGYYIPIINQETNEVIDKIKPQCITLANSEKYRDNIELITKYFNEKQFSRKIKKEDLNELNTKEFNKENLIEIFNKTIDSPLKTETGEYYDASFINRVNVSSLDENLVGEWQLTYLIDYGYISEVRIEFITNDNKYLLDMKNQETNKFSKGIKMIEENIIKNQNFDKKNLEKINLLVDLNYAKINNDLIELLSKSQETIMN